jgi:hypothetical protein
MYQYVKYSDKQKHVLRQIKRSGFVTTKPWVRDEYKKSLEANTVSEDPMRRLMKISRSGALTNELAAGATGMGAGAGENPRPGAPP